MVSIFASSYLTAVCQEAKRVQSNEQGKAWHRVQSAIEHMEVLATISCKGSLQDPIGRNQKNLVVRNYTLQKLRE